jgi:tetratricopeptide (TPR) repeat protein
VPGYEILGELGRGGMGVVYHALQRKAQRIVALKMILGGGHAGPEDLARFAVEAQAVARLQHPGIVQVFEVGEHNGLPFFSLEYCPGGSLHKKLAGTPLLPAEAAALVEKLAAAMQAAHDKGVLHRDLKPANVLLGAEGEPKITDFGLAKKLDEAGQTVSGAVLGTPSYMAPEQAEARKTLGPPTDVYALGAILYECLTGRPPFRAPTALDTLVQVVGQEPVPPRQLNPKVPVDLETICLKCLEKAPARRYGSARELAADLHSFGAGETIRARRAGLAERVLKYTRRKPWVVGAWAASVTAMLFLVAGGGYYLYRRNQDLQATLSRQQTLEQTRGKVGTRVATAEAALARHNWSGVLAAARETLALTGAEPELADLKLRAERLQDAAETVMHFLGLRDRALHHFMLSLEQVDQPTYRRAAQTAARQGLALVGLTDDGPAERPRLSPDVFPVDLQHQLTEHCFELYALWSETLLPTPAAALRLLDRSAPLELTTRSYHQRRAELLRILGDGTGAKAEEARAAALTPALAVDHFLLGLARYRAGDLEEAGVSFKKVLQQQPDHFWASYCLAGCYLRQHPQRFERALAPLTACIKLEPTFAWPYLLRGFVYGELRDFEAAFGDFAAAEKCAADESERYGLLVNRAVVRLRQGMDHEQRARTQRERHQPDQADQEARQALRCYEEAVPDLERAVKLSPQQPQAHANLAEVHLRRGRADEALPALDRAIALAPSAALYRTRARLHEQRGDYTEALADLEQALGLAQPATDPRERAGDHLQRGRILFRLGKFPAALNAFDQALAADPSLLVAHQLRGETLLELGQVAEAVAALDRYLAKGPPSALAARARGLGRAKLGDYAGAIEDYSRALEIDRAEGKLADPQTLAYRGWAYLIQEAPKLALRDFQEALRLGGGNRADCHAGRGYARMKLGQWQEAVADAEAALQGDAPPRTLFNTARIYAQAAARVETDRSLGVQAGQRLHWQYQQQALALLYRACTQTPGPQRAAFWKEYVEADPALRPVAGTADFSRMRSAFTQSVP